MPEMIDVIGGEIISSDWGNDIRDRTIQRYANTAERTALHPSPAAGDLAYMEDSGLIYVYHAGGWQLQGGRSIDVGQNMENVADPSITATFKTGANLTFTKPALWATYALLVWGTVHLRAQFDAGVGTSPEGGARIIIAGVAGNALGVKGPSGSAGLAFPLTISVADTRTGLTTSPVIGVQYSRVTPVITKEASTIQYLAIRTA